MLVDFIENPKNRQYIDKAVTAQKELSYFLEGDIQPNIMTSEYLRQYANRKFQSGSTLDNFLKSVLKTENFLTFVKYNLNPIPSAKIAKTDIEPHLRKVMFSEDSVFEYNLKNIDTTEINEAIDHNWISNQLFYHVVYRPNDILVDLPGIEEPEREFIKIDCVHSIEEDKKGNISKIAYKSCVTANIDGDEIEGKGYIYLDSEFYAFCNEDKELVFQIPHGLGRCPATYICDKRFRNEPVIKESIYTYPISDIRDYVILRIFQMITDTNGAFPITTILNAEIDEGFDDDRSHNQPSSDEMGGQMASQMGDNNNIGSGLLQPGTIHEAPLIHKQDGSIDMSVVENFIKFHYVPVDILKQISERVEGLKNVIISSVLGGDLGDQKQAMNTDQVARNTNGLENVLSYISTQMSVSRYKSDRNLLDLKYSNIPKTLIVHYGNDFYLEDIDKLMSDYKLAANPIEREGILLRMNNNKYKNNPSKKNRQNILYKLMPFSSDLDFHNATLSNVVSDKNKHLQLRFSYWINKFELIYGDIVDFYNSLESPDNDKIQFISNLIDIELDKEMSIVNNENDLKQQKENKNGNND